MDVRAPNFGSTTKGMAKITVSRHEFGRKCLHLEIARIGHNTPLNILKKCTPIFLTGMLPIEKTIFKKCTPKLIILKTVRPIYVARNSRHKLI